jgi:hypothetical protein
VASFWGWNNLVVFYYLIWNLAWIEEWSLVGGALWEGGGATVLHNSVLHELWWCVSIREGKNAFNFTINIDWVVCPWLDSFLNYRILCNYNLSYSYTAHLMNEKHICYVCVIWYWNCINNSEGEKITNLISASMSLVQKQQKCLFVSAI